MANDENELPDYAKDVLETAKIPDHKEVVETPPIREIRESELFNEGYARAPLPFWIWIALGAMTLALLWGLAGWMQDAKITEKLDAPFQKVTNREFALFLWQFPEYMRVNFPIKEGYLPAFEYLHGNTALIPSEADSLAKAPPEILFLYHNWSRLLKDNFPLPPITYEELLRFLNEEPAWQPQYWASAPTNLGDMVQRINLMSPKERKAVASNLPRELQHAIVSWQSYKYNGNAIEKIRPTYGEMAKFLASYPNYARNFWRNIFVETRPKYLLSFSEGNYEEGKRIPVDELAGFLQMAYYNAQQANKPSAGSQ